MRLVDDAPTRAGWLHEIKYDGYRMHARIDTGKATLLTSTGLERTIEALGSPLKLSRVHWVQPEVRREDKSASHVMRAVLHPLWRSIGFGRLPHND